MRVPVEQSRGLNSSETRLLAEKSCKTLKFLKYKTYYFHNNNTNSNINQFPTKGQTSQEEQANSKKWRYKTSYTTINLLHFPIETETEEEKGSLKVGSGSSIVTCYKIVKITYCNNLRHNLEMIQSEEANQAGKRKRYLTTFTTRFENHIDS